MEKFFYPDRTLVKCIFMQSSANACPIAGRFVRQFFYLEPSWFQLLHSSKAQNKPSLLTIRALLKHTYSSNSIVTRVVTLFKNNLFLHERISWFFRWCPRRRCRNWGMILDTTSGTGGRREGGNKRWLPPASGWGTGGILHRLHS